MSKINQYSAAEKLAVVQELEMGQVARSDVAQKYDISINTLVKWRHSYDSLRKRL